MNFLRENNYPTEKLSYTMLRISQQIKELHVGILIPIGFEKDMGY